MVSNVLGMEPEELVAELMDIRARHADAEEYRRLRADLPEDWPV